ncbi:unnamed protein product [Closterium sp. Yama58-4]|nr:unnamed protein product [Closterium sp. Yama58-4]
MAEEEELAMGSDDDADAESPEEILAKIDDRSQRVAHFLSEGRVPEALKAAVSNPPIATRDQKCKDANWEVVQRALVAIEDVDGAIAGLKSEGCDTLMRYLYRALRTGDPSLCARALRVHEKLTEKAGLGCIMRVMADRKHTV